MFPGILGVNSERDEVSNSHPQPDSNNMIELEPDYDDDEDTTMSPPPAFDNPYNTSDATDHGQSRYLNQGRQDDLAAVDVHREHIELPSMSNDNSSKPKNEPLTAQARVQERFGKEPESEAIGDGARPKNNNQFPLAVIQEKEKANSPKTNVNSKSNSAIKYSADEEISKVETTSRSDTQSPRQSRRDEGFDNEIQNFFQQRRTSHLVARHRTKKKSTKMETGTVSRAQTGGARSPVGDGDVSLQVDDHQTEEEIFENIQSQKEVVENMRFQPWSMKKKLDEVRKAKAYIEMHEGALSLSHGYQQVGYKAWQRFKRAFNATVVFFIPWEMRIKIIESHFGTVVSSYFIFIRWLVWVNILLAILTFAFIVLPEVLEGDSASPGKLIPSCENASAHDLHTLWDFGGIFKYSALFYGWYSSNTFIGDGYRLPLAYLLAGLSTYIISFVLVLRRMATNAKLNKATSDDEHYTFCWKLFTSWDCSIGSPETAKNKIAEICTIFKEAVLDVQEKEKKGDNKKVILFLRRLLANVLVVIVLAGSAYLVYFVVERSRGIEMDARNGVRQPSWFEVNEVSIVMSAITTLFPTLFDLIGMLELYHPMINLRWQLARIFVLYLLNLYTLYIALFYKITEMVAQETTHLNNHTYTTTALPPGTQPINCSTQQPAICWETMVGQEIVKLTNFDLIFTIAAVLIIDFFRGLVVRYCNSCCCWDLEMKFPEYGEFKIAENILHLIYNQGMIWLGTFFSPALPAINILKLMILLYIRSWAVLMCNIPHERVFRVSGSNNFYYFLTLVMLFLCTLPVGYAVTAITPSRDCGPFVNETVMYKLLSRTIDDELPQVIVDIINYATSPGILIPFFILLVMIIYYLVTLANSLKESNTDLKTQLHYERTEEKKKVYAMADGKNIRNSAEIDAVMPPNEYIPKPITNQPVKRQPTPEEVEQAKLRFRHATHLQALHLLRVQQRQLEQTIRVVQPQSNVTSSKNGVNKANNESA